MIRKIKRQKGEEYLSTTGKIISKTCSENPCGCKQECMNIITLERRKQIFDGYYNLNWGEKNAFLSGQIEVKKKTNRKYTKQDTSRRSKTRLYRLMDSTGVDQIVCKKFFQETLAICDGSITNALKRKQDSGTPQQCKSGKHPPANKTTSEDEQYVCDFISKFPTYESHYCRRDSTLYYLAPWLSKAKMYNMYIEECQSSNKNPISNFKFCDILNTKFSHLSFHPPQKDTCAICDEYKNQARSSSGTEQGQAKVLHELHLKKVEAIEKMKKNDIEEAKSSQGTKQVVVFDLQKTLPTPVLSTGEVYYKRQMWTYNLGIHDEVSNIGHMFVWPENVASRGAQEVSSCLLHFISNVLPPTSKVMTLYSDSCGGQNRNIKTVLFLSHVLQTHPNLDEINQKFFIPGHSFDSCDRDFGIIERSKAYHEEIFIPTKWEQVIKEAKKKNPKFKVYRMTSKDFYSSKSLECEITNRKISEDKQKVEWLKIRWLQLKKDSPKKIFYKYSLSDFVNFSVVDLAKRESRGRPQRELPNQLDILYPRGRPITKEKKKDLLSLLKYIPPIHHNFYKNLKVDEAGPNPETEDTDEDKEHDNINE